jgi:hypothetical protein
VSPYCLLDEVLTDLASCREVKVRRYPVMRPGRWSDAEVRFLVCEILPLHGAWCGSCLCCCRRKAGRSPMPSTHDRSDVTADTSVPPPGKRKHKDGGHSADFG